MKGNKESTEAPTFSNFNIRFQLPKARNHGFKGREDLLDKLHRALGQSESIVHAAAESRRVAVIHGLGGIGKSQISIEYSYRYAFQFSSVFWIDATSQATLFQGLIAMAERLVKHYSGPPGGRKSNLTEIADFLGLWGCVESTGHINLEGQSPELLLRAMREWLAIENNTHWLVIFDDYNNPASVGHNDLIPVGDFGNIIFTTRNPELQQYGEGIEVGEIEKEPGISILLGSAKIDSLDTSGVSLIYSNRISMKPIQYQKYLVRQEAEEIADRLSYLPLALDQAGAYISAMQIPLARYLAEYDSKFEAMATKTHQALLERYKHPFYTTWNISADVLCPSSRQLLHLCAFLGTKDISENLFLRGKAQARIGMVQAVPPKLV